METNIELDPKILQKNLEITKLKARVDSLTSDLVYMKAEHTFKPFILSILNETHELIINLSKDVLTAQRKEKMQKTMKE